QKANRDTLLASEQRSYDASIRERDAVLGLLRNIEQRSDEKKFVPPWVTQPTLKPEAKRGLLFGLELRALAEGSPPGSVIAPDEGSSSFFDKLSAESVALRSGIRVIRTMRDVLHVPHITADPTAAWTAEAAAITPSDPNYADVPATPRKLATLTQISN